MSHTNLLLAALAAVAWGCGDRGLKSQETSGRGQTAPHEGASSGGDLAGLAFPGIEGSKTATRDAGPAMTPEERKELRATLDKALAENRLDEAIATADVLAVLFPDDPEILELRGRALLRQGDAEGSARDLARCCELDRTACCGGKPR
jgi:hypothetical protein